MDIESLIYPIEFKNRTDIIKIKPLMDLHYGAKTCDLKAFKAFISNNDEFTYYFINGDLWDSIYFDDKRFSASGHDHTDDDDPIDLEVKEMAAILEPIKSRIIAIGIGNHEYTILKKHHTNLSKRLADALGVPYMGFSYFFRINLFRVDDEIKGQGRNIDFFVQHGFGGGTRTEGGSITKYAKHSERFICDVYVAGHDHRLQFVKFPTMGIRGAKGSVRLFAKSKVVILGGSWKKAYAPGTAVSWEETKGFMPAEIGGVTIRIRVTNDWVDIKVDM